MTRTVKVKDLKAGNALGGCTVIESPVLVGDFGGSKNQMRLKVRYSNGKESVRHWGKETTVKIYE
jgi:hypothetical protein